MKLAALNNIAAVILVKMDITPRFVQVKEVNLLYLSIAIHKTIATAEMKTRLKVRFAPVVLAGNNILQIVPRIIITVRTTPVTIPVLMAFLITQFLAVKKRIFVLKIAIISNSTN